jgi:protein-S-isoprenylcysteine O-methyltransferase Ste14
VRVLGRYFTTSVAVRPRQRVVNSGPYRWVRHPSYSGSLLTLVGLCVTFTNWLSFVALIPALVGFSYRILVEERALIEALGLQYREYMTQTKRLVPFLF